MLSLRTILAPFSLSAALLGGPMTASATNPGECNIYYPLPTRGTWIYQESTGDGTPRATKIVRVLSADGEATNRKATLEQEVRAPAQTVTAVGRARLDVRCDGGRISMTLRGAAQGRDGKATAQAVVTAHLNGLPPAPLLVAGYTWNSTNTIETKEGQTSANARSQRRSEVIGAKAISVPAGHFPEALEIHTREILEQTGLGRSVRQEIRAWYVKDVGLVKRETRLIDHPSSMSSLETLSSSTLIAAD